MPDRQPLSVAIITYNEESNITDCLRSVAWADQIIVVDSLSTDRTVEIAQSFGAVVILQKFLGHVKQKQLAVDHCLHDWVLCIDADERVSPELQESIEALLAQDTQEHWGYKVKRRSFHLGRWIMHGGWYPDCRVRLFHTTHGHWAGVDPHDRLTIEGKSDTLKGDLEHYVFRDLSHNVATNNSYSSISARMLHEQGKKASLLKIIFKPFGKFIETYLVGLGFLDGLPGFIISIGAAYSMFLKQVKLWEIQQGKSTE